MTAETFGKVHSVQTLGTVDGPGVRFVVFLQGCNLRCKCCHNPDTWSLDGGKPISANELVCKAKKYREYFGKDGGVTVSGGEPLLQASFVYEFFSLCHKENINTCLDTSGAFLNDDVVSMLSVTDRVLLDIKYTQDALYRENVGCSIDAPLNFLEYLNTQKIPTTLRQVIITGINDTAENINKLKAIAKEHIYVDKIELLPFKKLCSVKYDNMKIPFPFEHIPEPSLEKMTELKNLIKDYL